MCETAQGCYIARWQFADVGNKYCTQLNCMDLEWHGLVSPYQALLGPIQKQKAICDGW